MAFSTYPGYARHIIGVAVTAVLAACGGGGDSAPSSPATGSSGTPNNQQAATITGKAVDGYLVGAVACLDLNNNGVCDSGEPSATTDATGQFSIPYSGDPTGKALLVQVTTATKDLSRPTGFQFPASFTLSQVVQSAGAQVVSPLTTLVATQMQTGLSRAQAVAVVQGLIGSQIDPNADYVANHDATTLALAQQIVDKVGSFSTNGTIDGTTQRNVLNAIVAKGSVTSVTSQDVAAQAGKPVYQIADASQILAQPTYSFVDYLISFFGGFNQTPGSTNQALVRDVRQIVNGALQTQEQENLPVGGSVWSNVALGAYNGGKYDGLSGEYVLKADGTWSNFVTETQRLAALPLSLTGTTLSGTDPISSIAFSYTLRSVDLSGQPLSVAAPAVRGFYDFAHASQLTSATFPTGTTGYLGIQSSAADRIVLPISVPMCDNASIQNGLVCNSTPAYSDGNAIVMTSGSANTTYTSVQQAIGINLQGQNIGVDTLKLAADHTAVVNNVTATWSAYAANANVLIIDIASSDGTGLAATSGRLSPLVLGAKLVIALRQGHLQIGWLYPTTYADKSIQFVNNLPSTLTSALNSVIATLP
ncbi:hypothetical protein [Burkholderia sp. 22PA0106]|uniref:hypothetical protein n=1 Tax=Burkholderia sp. 22PA0106 TaxID=3237371 RepID=UPI0039C0905B